MRPRDGDGAAATKALKVAGAGAPQGDPRAHGDDEENALGANASSVRANAEGDVGAVGVRWPGILPECSITFDLQTNAKVTKAQVGRLANIVLGLGNSSGGLVEVCVLVKQKYAIANKYVEDMMKQLDAVLRDTVPRGSDSASNTWTALRAGPTGMTILVRPFEWGTRPRYVHSAWRRQERQKTLMTTREFTLWQRSQHAFPPDHPFIDLPRFEQNEIVAIAESTRVELKRERSAIHADELPKYLCAFRNGDGGLLCFGLEEVREGQARLVGVEPGAAKLLERELSSAAASMYPAIPASEMRCQRYPLTPSGVIVIFRVEPSLSQLCTQLCAPREIFLNGTTGTFEWRPLQQIQAIVYDRRHLDDVRRAYFKNRVPGSIVDIIEHNVVYPFDNGWLVPQSFFRASSPLRALQHSFLLLENFGVVCGCQADAKLLVLHLWPLGFIRMAVATRLDDAAAVSSARRQYYGHDWSHVRFIDDTEDMQACIIQLGMLFNGLDRADEATLQSLTAEQAKILISNHRERSLATSTLLIGPPGSGKTLVALELIRDALAEASEGEERLSALYVCANRPLANHIEACLRVAAGAGPGRYAGITVGVASDLFPTDSDLRNNKIIIFDELQSYPNSTCWTFFEAAAATAQTGDAPQEIWAMVDPAQAVRRSDSGLPTFENLVQHQHTLLSQVVRNARGLFDVTKQWVNQKLKSKEEQRWIKKWGPHARNGVMGEVDYLCGSAVDGVRRLMVEGAASCDIVVLVANLDLVAESLEALSTAGIPCRRELDQPRLSNRVTVESVHHFKGLERPYVVFKAPVPEPQHMATLIGAFSRATIKCLVVVDDEEVLSCLRNGTMKPSGEFEAEKEMEEFIVDDNEVDDQDNEYEGDDEDEDEEDDDDDDDDDIEHR